jgi:hypothetical protein
VICRPVIETLLSAGNAGHQNATLAVNHLEDSFSASPALVDRELYLRGERFLYCIAEPDAR